MRENFIIMHFLRIDLLVNMQKSCRTISCEQLRFI